ncbi:LysR family transcriptional regulator substrate-binding protein [Bacillus thuringiensis]|nr:LysR family transcriptional regulator substrate-binding protein [Bacillus thuringiensis]NUW50720.1 LysR family transcriptional regulator substrate-binding protein [Bacillus thuringiensis]HDR6819429.1 LysR family transcriptional regulator substrate-binding protein [Bacillus thuringiensis]
MEIQEKIQQEDIDFCISSPPIQQIEVITVPIMTEEVFLAVSPNHYLANRSIVQLSDITKESFISLKTDYNFREFVIKYFSR